MKKRLVVSGIIFLVLAGLALPKLLPHLRGSEGKAPAAGAARPPKEGRETGGAPLQVQAVAIQPTRLAESVTATGTLRADEAIDLQTEINGKIIQINFEEGAEVRKGAVLVKIYDADLQASLQTTLARKSLAEIRERRSKKLLQEGGTNQQDYDAAVSELNVQRGQVELIEAQISKTEIRAPFDGVVGLRYVSEGAYVAPATRIATLQRLQNIKIDFAVPERYAPRVRLGSAITFTIAGESSAFSGRVYAVEPRIEVATRTVVIRAVTENTDGRLRPGSFAQVEFKLAEVDDALLVPAEAVVPGLSEKTVFVVENGKAARRTVRAGTRNERHVQILEGLKPGDVVITSGLQQIRAGTPVSVMMPSES